ncbi:MAG: hypothetical protein AAFX85_06230, partial [Pseudomonadota bacterium]
MIVRAATDIEDGEYTDVAPDDATGVIITNDDRLDTITRLACAHFDAPLAMIEFVDVDQRRLRAARGLGRHTQTKNVSFATHTLLSRDSLVVGDTLLDPRFRNDD